MTDEEKSQGMSEPEQPAEPEELAEPQESKIEEGAPAVKTETSDRDEPKPGKKGISERKFKLGITVAVIVIVVGVLLWGMVPEEIIDVEKIAEDPAKYDGEEINVKGVVLDWDGSAMNFTLADSLDLNITIHVQHSGGPPEGFGNNVTIVTKGTFASALMTLESISIQVGCPSKY